MVEFLNAKGLPDVSDPVYSASHLKSKLQEKYGQHIYFAGVHGRKNVVCFQDLCSFIVSDAWYAQQKRDDDSEKKRIIKTVAKLTVAEIRDMKSDLETYRPLCSVENYHSDFLSPLLSTFLNSIVSDRRKSVAVGHCLMQAARPRSVLSPLLLGLSIELDHLHGSSFLVTHLSHLGFCGSYDELTCYKQSFVTSQKPGQTDGLPYPTAMTQWVGDNVDHNLQTTDGQGTFHGMGLIAVSVPLQGNFAIQEQPVKRLSSKLPVSALVADRGIPILSYDRPGRCGLQNVTMTEISELKRLVQVTLPLLAHLDTLWHLKWFFKDISNLWPN